MVDISNLRLLILGEEKQIDRKIEGKKPQAKI